jgi:hypothetical protein
MSDEQTATLAKPAAVWSVRLTKGKKLGTFGACGAISGRIQWNQWQPVPYRTSVPFSSYDDGYACMKIPVLQRTSSGTLLVMAEARTPDCGDFSRTDLVVKRSTDGGLTWSPLRHVANVTAGQSASSGADGGLCGNPPVVGNAAPVQLGASDPHHPNRILVPHTLNNYEVCLTLAQHTGIFWT